jgi:outer membrane protein assembly factor BamD (BamD/ComL family)
MIDAYTELGMTDLAGDTQRVLALNEQSGALIQDPQELVDQPIGARVWDFFGLDEN